MHAQLFKITIDPLGIITVALKDHWTLLHSFVVRNSTLSRSLLLLEQLLNDWVQLKDQQTSTPQPAYTMHQTRLLAGLPAMEEGGDEARVGNGGSGGGSGTWVDLNEWETVTGKGKIVSKFKNQK